MRIVGVTDVRYVGNWRQLMQFKDPTLIQKKIAKVVVKEPPGRYCSSAYFNDVLLCTDSSNVDYFVQQSDQHNLLCKVQNMLPELLSPRLLPRNADGIDERASHYGIILSSRASVRCHV